MGKTKLNKKKLKQIIQWEVPLWIRRLLFLALTGLWLLWFSGYFGW